MRSQKKNFTKKKKKRKKKHSNKILLNEFIGDIAYTLSCKCHFVQVQNQGCASI